MRQISLRLEDELADAIAAEAARRGLSLNAWMRLVTTALVDPEHAEGEVAQVRERLRRAGLIEEDSTDAVPAVGAEALARARAAAGRGTPLSQIVIDGRGPR